MMRFIGGLIVVAMIGACAPWAPAPVEDRSERPAPQAERRAEPRREPRPKPPAPAVYEVQRGDTLYSIAFNYGLDWRAVARWNRIDAPYTIRPGQELRLTEPPQETVAVREARSDSPTPPAEDRPASRPQSTEQTQSPASQDSRAPAPSGDATARSVRGVDWQWPTEGKVTRPYDASAARRGIGIAGTTGQPVVSAAAGEVVYSGTALIGYGELIIIKHSDSLLSAYGYNQSRMVEEGDRVGRGQKIAEMGLNDRNEEMLHFEVRRNGQPEDPLAYLPGR